ncbi:MAG: hypothetical protein RL398_1096, partial [Planctomycetota bacterium]
MNRILQSAAVALALFPCLLPAQGEAKARKTGTIFKSEVDWLIGVVRDSARRSGSAGLGETTADTAKILVAMANCHRRYHISDGPVVRPSLGELLRARAADGSFGDVAATAWVVEALTAMDPDGYREEVAQARAWLAKRAPADGIDGFAARVQAVLGEVRSDVFPEHVGRAAAGRAMFAKLAADGAWVAAKDAPTRAEAPELLLTLVACQVANRRLDQGEQAQSAPVAWTPAQQKGFDWLMSRQKDGVFPLKMGSQEMLDPAMTSFGLMSLQSKPKAARTQQEQAVIENGLRWLLSKQNEDGTFGEQTLNYTTCVAAGALSRWGDPAALPALQKAQRAILAFQNVEDTGYQRSDRDYGSIGYGNSQRGDLSNLQFSIEALRATGLPSDHEALQKALVFLQRTQNLKSVNDFQGKVPDPDREDVILDATSGDDGGASYYPGNSNAGYIVLPNGKSVPRSYGSMTYALLKSYTLAGVKGDDVRVQAAIDWIRRNWTLAVNPGADPALGEKVQFQGLFYYYMVLAQALDAAKVKTIDKVTVVDGVEKTEAVDWRKELRTHLESIQRPDGTWINGKNGRWMENVELLCTCYAM